MHRNNLAFRWRIFLKGMGIAVLGLALLQGYDKLGDSEQGTGDRSSLPLSIAHGPAFIGKGNSYTIKLRTRSETMEAIAKTESTPKMVKPSIDLAAPVKTETATFALG